MPFNRRYDTDTGDYIIDRTQTGNVPPPSTGTTVAEDGAVVAKSATISIIPSTPVSVTLPGPNEPVVDSDGRMNPRWWRFLNELYRRTGGPIDNINRVPTTLLGTGTAASLTFTGAAPTIAVTTNNQVFPTVGSVAITGFAPTAVVA